MVWQRGATYHASPTPLSPGYDPHVIMANRSRLMQNQCNGATTIKITHIANRRPSDEDHAHALTINELFQGVRTMPDEPIDFDKIGERIEDFLESREELRHLVPGFNAVRDAIQNAANASNNPASGNSDDPIDYRKINKRVEKKMKKRKDFQDAVVAFFVMSAMTWAIYFVFNGFNLNTPPWPLVLMAIMAVIVVWQGIETYYLAEARERARDRLLQEEIRRERMRMYSDAEFEKPKREPVARLADDGELIYEDKPARQMAQRKE